MLNPKPNNPLLILRYFLALAVLLGGGWLWFNSQNQPPATSRLSGGKSRNASPAAPALAPNTLASTPTIPANVQVRIDGATSMVSFNQALKDGFERKYAGSQVLTQAQGSTQGLGRLTNDQVDIAAVSRPLTAQESGQGLRTLAVSDDPIALVVGINNPLSGGLTPEQIGGIFQGTITDWSQVGGKGKIRVVNRAEGSGTRQVFQESVLKGAAFGSGANVTTLTKDATTPLLQALGNDGIGYATYAQVAKQQTVRVVNVAGLSPTQPNYPYSRSLLYVYKEPPSPAAAAFLRFCQEPEGQQAIRSANELP